MPGKTNSATDATSRYLSPSNPETLDDELAMTAAIHFESNKLIGISWECLVDATKRTRACRSFLMLFRRNFQIENMRRNLQSPCTGSIVNHSTFEVVVYRDRVVVPSSLRDRVLQILHQTHIQGFFHFHLCVL